jgi:hypothetical protein
MVLLSASTLGLDPTWSNAELGTTGRRETLPPQRPARHCKSLGASVAAWDQYTSRVEPRGGWKRKTYVSGASRARCSPPVSDGLLLRPVAMTAPLRGAGGGAVGLPRRPAWWTHDDSRTPCGAGRDQKLANRTEAATKIQARQRGKMQRRQSPYKAPDAGAEGAVKAGTRRPRATEPVLNENSFGEYLPADIRRKLARTPSAGSIGGLSTSTGHSRIHDVLGQRLRGTRAQTAASMAHGPVSPMQRCVQCASCARLAVSDFSVRTGAPFSGTRARNRCGLPRGTPNQSLQFPDPRGTGGRRSSGGNGWSGSFRWR